MPSLRRIIVTTAALAALVPATATAALVKVADPINVAPDAAVALEQYYPDVAMASDGSFAVSYSEVGDRNVGSDSERVWVQRFTAGFAKLGPRIAVGPAQRDTQPAIAMAPDGRFAVAFQTYSPFPATPDHFVAVQRFHADGTPDGGLLVPDGANGDNDGNPPAIAMADDGRLAVAWIGKPAALRLLAYTASGTPAPAGVQELDSASPSDARPSIGMAGDGRFLLTAKVNTDVGTLGGVYGWRFGADGTPSGGRATLWTGAMNYNYPEPAVGMADDGRTFLAFTGVQTAGYESDVWGRRFDAAGTPLGERFGVGDYTAYSQSGADVEVDDDGDAFIAYEGQNGTQRWGYVRHFSPAGTPDGTEEHISTAPDGATQRIHVDSDGSARTALAYQFSNQGTNNEVFVARWNYAPVTDPPPADGGGGGGQQPPSGGGGGPAAPAPASASPAGVPAAPAKPVSGAGVTKLDAVVTFPSTKSCASRRSFGIRLRVPKGAGVQQAIVKVNGRRVAVLKGARLRSTVDLRTLPKGRFTVSIELRLATGKVLKGERRYRTCAVKRRGGKPKV
jgi:hypothetical protein